VTKASCLMCWCDSAMGASSMLRCKAVQSLDFGSGGSFIGVVSIKARCGGAARTMSWPRSSASSSWTTWELPGDAYHREFQVLDTRDHEPFHDDLSIHTLELPKLQAVQEVNTAGEPLLIKWGRFLKVQTTHDLEQLAMGDPLFEEAKNALEHLSADPKAQALAEERRIWAWNYENQLHLAKREGFAEGEASGEARGLAKGQQSLLIRQLRQKFGPLSSEHEIRLRSADEAELSLWADRVLTATTIEEVFAEGSL
jgi:hypothetical protein